MTFWGGFGHPNRPVQPPLGSMVAVGGCFSHPQTGWFGWLQAGWFGWPNHPLGPPLGLKPPPKAYCNQSNNFTIHCYKYLNFYEEKFRSDVKPTWLNSGIKEIKKFKKDVASVNWILSSPFWIGEHPVPCKGESVKLMEIGMIFCVYFC
jgi:hypothetical protein